ncbi:pitrilysin family protein [uncultured Stenotrophomonas sp.]|uniref:M16 family metallopeptidase n=1 Tax=uncultured Stenotrophomonas sp. TaxID=165438 RepID=UPI0025E84BFD|nr:pitrilysin family protein [uncultured Stenotrophomonas sp.]
MGAFVGGAKRLLWTVLAAGAFTVPVAARNPETAPHAPAAVSNPVDIPFERFTLPNGLRVVVHTDRKAPIVAVHLWYRVGSGDEPAGRTGFAHLFEHLMFRGTEHYRDAYYGPLQRVGATDVNATVTPERTNYMQVVPTTALDLALWMESDRMGHLLGAIDQKALDTERGIVGNEKLQRRGVPYGLVWEQLSRSSYPPGHPYHHSTFGSAGDLQAATLADVQDWFQTWYGPNNAVLVLSGDVGAEEARKKVESYFGHIPPAPEVTRASVDVARRASTTREILSDQVALARVHRTWNIAARGTSDFDQLRVLAHILGGGNASRLGKRLVHADQLATDVTAEAGGQLGSRLMIVANVRDGVDPSAVETAIEAELQRLLKDGPTGDEVQRTRTAMRAEFVKSIERNGGMDGKAEVLAACEVFEGDAGCYRRSADVVASVTPDQLVRVARRWLGQGDHILTVIPGARAAFAEEAEPAGAASHAHTPTEPYRVPVSGVDRSAGPPFPETFPELRFPSIKRAKLSNGTQVILARREDVPLIRMSYQFPVDPAGTPGLADMAFSMLAEGAGGYDALAFAARAESLGAELGSSVDVGSSAVALVSLSDTLDDSVALYADMLRRPRFEPVAMERMRAAKVGALGEEAASPQRLATRLFPALLYGLDHPYAQAFNAQGTVASVEALRRNDLVAFHRAWIRPEQGTLVVVGDTTLQTLIPVLERHLGDWRGSGGVPEVRFDDRVPAQAGPRVFLVDSPGAPQATLVAGQLVAPSSDPQTLAFEVANSVLGGSPSARLNMNLREAKGWSYGVISNAANAPIARPWRAVAPVQSDRVADAMAEIQREIAEYASGPAPARQDEVARFRDSQVRRLAGGFETREAIVSEIADIVRFDRPDDWTIQRSSALRQLDLNEVRAAAAALDASTLTWVVVGDLSRIEAPVRALGLGEVTVIDSQGTLLQ